jgi:hypothetical protein
MRKGFLSEYVEKALGMVQVKLRKEKVLIKKEVLRNREGLLKERIET